MIYARIHLGGALLAAVNLMQPPPHQFAFGQYVVRTASRQSAFKWIASGPHQAVSMLDWVSTKLMRDIFQSIFRTQLETAATAASFYGTTIRDSARGR